MIYYPKLASFAHEAATHRWSLKFPEELGAVSIGDARGRILLVSSVQAQEFATGLPQPGELAAIWIVRTRTMLPHLVQVAQAAKMFAGTGHVVAEAALQEAVAGLDQVLAEVLP